MSTEHMHVTSGRVFNNNSRKKIARNCVQHNCVFRVEVDDVNVFVFLFPSFSFLTSCCIVVLLFFFFFCLIRQSLCYLYSRNCVASRDLTVSFRVWPSGRYDFRRDGIFSVKDGCGTYGVLCITSVVNKRAV